jgi:hypothetical protein
MDEAIERIKQKRRESAQRSRNRRAAYMKQLEVGAPQGRAGARQIGTARALDKNVSVWRVLRGAGRGICGRCARTPG